MWMGYKGQKTMSPGGGLIQKKLCSQSIVPTQGVQTNCLWMVREDLVQPSPQINTSKTQKTVQWALHSRASDAIHLIQ